MPKSEQLIQEKNQMRSPKAKEIKNHINIYKMNEKQHIQLILENTNKA